MPEARVAILREMRLEDQLRKLETDLLQPEIRRSSAAVYSLLAEEFCEFGSSGRIYTRQEIIEALATESTVSISVSEFSVMRLAVGVALVRYRAVSGESISLRSSVWVIRDGRWQMVFHQGTKKPPR
jgi:hypothetical protein